MATKSVINPIDIQGIPLVLSPRPEVQQLIASWANVDYTSLNVIGTFNLIFNVLPIVANQTAAALAVEGAVKNRMSDDLVFIPTEPRIETNCVLVWRQGRVITPVVQELITRFEQAFGH